MNGKPPILVREIEDTLIRFLYEEVHGGLPNVVIESMDDVDKLLEKKPEEKENAEFRERYRKSKIFFDARYNDSKTQVELASENDVQQARISEFQRGIEPALISRLRRFEEKRLIEEWKENRSIDYLHDQGPDILERYLKSRHSETVELMTSSMHNISVGDSSKLNGVLRELDVESFAEKGIVSIANEISSELAEKESRVMYWILDDSILEEHPQILSMLKENRVGLEREVRKQSSDHSIHLGIVDDRVYLWNPDKTPNDMMNVWGKKYFYFNPSILAQIVLETRTHLDFPEKGYDKLRHLNKLIDQIISSNSGDKIWSKYAKSRVLGDVLHLQCDILGVSPRVLEKHIERVAGRNGHGGIPHPKFLRGSELEILRARLGAIINSDCWLGEDGRLYYSEADEERLKIVANLFQNFGDMSFKIEPSAYNESYRMWIPRPVGDAFIFWGFTSGDKPVQNERLSVSIRDGSLDSYIAYLEDLISEDGSFDRVNGFRWSRTVVLKLGKKDTKFAMESKLSDEEINFLTNFKDARRYPDEVYIPITRLEKSANNQDESESVIISQILRAIEENRSRLLDDEASLARKLGIDIQVIPEHITLYKESGRISLKWMATTKRKDDAIMWALIAPPNDARKKGIVEEWLSLIPNDVERIKNRI
jgi:hypothetical protein